MLKLRSGVGEQALVECRHVVMALEKDQLFAYPLPVVDRAGDECFVIGRGKRRGRDDATARPYHSDELLHCRAVAVVGDVLQHRDADHGIEGSVLVGQAAAVLDLRQKTTGPVRVQASSVDLPLPHGALQEIRGVYDVPKPPGKVDGQLLGAAEVQDP